VLEPTDDIHRALHDIAAIAHLQVVVLVLADRVHDKVNAMVVHAPHDSVVALQQLQGLGSQNWSPRSPRYRQSCQSDSVNACHDHGWRVSGFSV